MYKSIYLIAIAIAVISAITAFVATQNLIIALLVLALYIIYFMLSIKQIFIPFLKKTKRTHECFNFVNCLIISLSVKHSLPSAYESAILGIDGELLDEVSNIEHLVIDERIKYLKNYFSSDIYQMFLNILVAYEDQGGNILNMSESLIKELTRIENESNEYNKLGKRKVVEFASLWLLTYAILIFIRFALSQFYSQIASSLFFCIAVFVFFMFVLFSIHLLITSFTKMKLSFRKGT